MINEAKGEGDAIAQDGVAEGEEVKTVRTVKTRGKRKGREKGRKAEG